MRKLIFLLVAITLPVFAFKVNAEENEVKEIPLERKADKRLERTSFIVSIESCYNGMLSSGEINEIGQVLKFVYNE